jgi:YVTN family beta-propeller protein
MEEKPMRNKILGEVVCGLAGMLFAVEGWAAPQAYVTNNRANGYITVIDTAFIDAAAAVVGQIVVGNSPVRILISPDGRTAYVANSVGNPGTISVIDLTAASPVAVNVAVGTDPTALSITPDGSKLYVANNDAGTVSVVDTGTLQVATITVGNGPNDILVTPDGARVIVVNQGDDTAMIIETTTDTVVDTVNVSDDPRAIAITPDGQKAYIANAGTSLGLTADTVSVINLSTLQVVSIDVGDQPQSLAVTPDGSWVVVANALSDSVSILRTADDQKACDVTVGGGPSSVVVHPGSLLAYIADTFSDRVSVIDIVGCVEVVRPTVGNSPVDLEVTSDGSAVYIVNRGDGDPMTADETVSVLNTNDNTVTTITVPSDQVGINTVDPAPWAIAIGPLDSDGDGYGDPGDICPTISNPAQDDLCRATNLSASPSASSVTLTWGVPAGVASGFVVTEYRVYRDNELLGNTTDLTYSDDGLTEETAYRFAVTVVDGTGYENLPAELEVTTSKKSDGGGGGLCFIATAAFGSPLEPQVVLLREFRDRMLKASGPGRAFVRLYERYSPPLADSIAKSEGLRAMVRVMLWPAIGLAWIAVKFPLWAMMLGGLGLLGTGGFIWYGRRFA